MNTVFKFYYQGWVTLALASAYALWRLLSGRTSWIRGAGRTIFAAFSTLLVLAGLVYTVGAGVSRLNYFRTAPDLDGASEVKRDNPDDWAAIEWLRMYALPENPAGTLDLPVILEAPGKSYNYEGRISAFTGLPSVLGWALHEDQWRGSYEEQGKREPDIATIFSTTEQNLTLDLLRKYQVQYVILGNSERYYIEQVCSEPERRCNLARVVRKFESTLTPVFQQGQLTIYSVPGSPLD